ncbi:hypothetical protein I33_2084 [Bacillus subtilis subsp. subtilis str. RO-NN-1]|nr:hypothetical protein I33_2084 [Bacillus subtilis subsp. subtilis str. RO-NN-1]
MFFEFFLLLFCHSWIQIEKHKKAAGTFQLLSILIWNTIL